MTKFKEYINKIENQDFKEFTKYLDDDEFTKLEYHFNTYAKQLTITDVSQQRELLADQISDSLIHKLDNFIGEVTEVTFDQEIQIYITNALILE